MKINNTHNQKGGYSIIAAVLMVGFLLVLTTSTLNLVLQEMQDGKGRQDYMKAYAGAEWALELALFHMKQKGYGYDDDSFQKSEILGAGNKLPKLTYEFESMVHSYSWSIGAYGTDIIPLFWVNNLWVQSWMTSASHIDLDTESDMIWNIITQNGGVSGTWSFIQSTLVWEKTLNAWNLEYNGSLTVWTIFSWEDYILLYNPTWWKLRYELDSSNGFTLPRATISSSASIWKYTQNLETLVDNTKFLWILKYSIFSWN